MRMSCVIKLLIDLLKLHQINPLFDDFSDLFYRGYLSMFSAVFFAKTALKY